jgi:lipooligosaccharide transport system permease protein
MTGFVAGAIARPDLSTGTFRVWQRNRDVLLRLWKSEVVVFSIEPVLATLALGIGLGRFVTLGTGDEYITFLAPGLLAVWPMFTAVFECAFGSYVRLQMQGTYRAIVATPVSVDDVVAGDMVWGMTRAALNATWILVVLLALDRWLPTVSSPWAVLIAPLSLLPGLLFSAISMCYVSLARAMTQFNYFFNLVVNPMFWFGGAFFPVESLPGWARTISWFIPTTHVVPLYKALLSGVFEWSLLADLVWLLVGTAFFFFLALAAMRRRLIE